MKSGGEADGGKKQTVFKHNTAADLTRHLRQPVIQSVKIDKR